MRTSKRLFNPDRDDAKTFNPQVTPAVDPGPRLFDVTPHRRKESRKHPRLSEQRFISIVQRNDAAGEPRAKDRHFPRPSVAVLAPHESEERLRMVRQPETRPISPEQLIAEVKGIYAGLIMVEAKCCEVDAKQHQAALEMDGRQPTLNNEQWKALIALHRTLLHEHHDFLAEPATEDPIMRVKPNAHGITTATTKRNLVQLGGKSKAPPTKSKKSAAAATSTKPGQDKIDTPISNLFGLSGTGGFVPGMLGLAGKLLGKTHHQSSGLQGRLNGHTAFALADSASWANVMTEAYASKNNFLIDRSPQNIKDVPMATGSLRIIGKVTVKWTFEDEPDQAYIIDFDVALKSVYDIILGNPFLQKTKSLDEYKYRLVQMPQCQPGGNILCINNIGDLYQKLPMMARVPGRSRKFRMQGLPDTGAEGEVMSEAYARKNNLKLLRSDTKFLLPDGTLVDSIGRVCLFLSFEDEPGNPIPTYFEVMRDCRHEVILGHNFVFEHRIFSDNMHRLVNIIGQIGLNLIIFFEKQKNAGMSNESLHLPGANSRSDAARVQDEIRRHNAVHAIAMDNRVQRRAGQSSGLLHVLSTTAPALLGQNLAQGPPNLMDNPNTRNRARLPWWRRVFCLR
jgi:hypothetical protein